jgi:hypothetical protein
MVAKCELILKSIYRQDTHGTLMSDICMLDSNMNNSPGGDNVNKWHYNEATLKPLDKETYKVLVVCATNSSSNGGHLTKMCSSMHNAGFGASSISVPLQGKRTVLTPLLECCLVDIHHRDIALKQNGSVDAVLGHFTHLFDKRGMLVTD